LLAVAAGIGGSVVRADIVAFTGGDYDGWSTWNWEAISHLGFWSEPNDAIRSRARAADVKLFIDSGLPDPKTWGDSGNRATFAASMAEKVQHKQLDGVFFDEEGHLTSEQQQDYVKLAQAVTDALKPLNASLFICVGGRPTYEFRDYKYGPLADASEFLFIMGYDMHFWDDYTCVAKGTCSAAEAPLPDVTDGVKEYVAQVPPHKLVLGLPWYGQRYTSIAGLPINEGQIDYKDVLSVLDQKGRVVKRELEDKSQSWKITCNGPCVNSTKKGNVIWYDDASTLKTKYKVAADAKLRGVGMWKADSLPAPSGSSDPHADDRAAMWAAIRDWKNATGTDGV
jgi:GH18 family chitinase